jgi:O-antigen ligase
LDHLCHQFEVWPQRAISSNVRRVSTTEHARQLRTIAVPGFSSGYFSRSVTQRVLVAGLVLSTATQLRVGFVGAGELLLIAYVALRLLDLFRGYPVWTSSATRWVTRFWVIFGLAMAGGVLWAELAGDDFRPTTVEESAKLLLVGLLTILVARYEGGESSQLFALANRALAWVTTVFFGLWLLSLVTTTIGPLTLLYAGSNRFQGWSTNPNQVAIFLAAAPLLFLSSQVTFQRLALSIAATIVGIATLSDGFQLALVSGLAVALIVAAYRTASRPTLRTVFALLAGLGLSVLSAVLGASAVQERATAALNDGGGGGSGRGELWRASVELAGGSPLLGYGPGVGVTSGKAAGLEAHNTLLDVLIRAGAVGLAAFVVLCLVLLWRGFRQGATWFGAIVSLLTMGLTSFQLRQPLFWISLLALIPVVVKKKGTVDSSLPKGAERVAAVHALARPSRATVGLGAISARKIGAVAK